MTPNDDNAAPLGTVLQYAALPTASGMDAIEARLVPVQEVPPRAEVHFYALRGGARERLTTAEATAVLHELVPQKAISTLSHVELLVEVSVLRTEVARLRPIYAAAKAWRAGRAPRAVAEHQSSTEEGLIEAVDTATSAAGTSS